MTRLDGNYLPLPTVDADCWYVLYATQEFSKLATDMWRLAWEVSRSGNEPDYGNAIFLKNRVGKAPTLFFSPAARLNR